MSTVFRAHGFRVMVYTDDHPPAHVHAKGQRREARFILNCPDGPVELWDTVGTFRPAEIGRLGAAIAARLDACCTLWSKYHG